MRHRGRRLVLGVGFVLACTVAAPAALWAEVRAAASESEEPDPSAREAEIFGEAAAPDGEEAVQEKASDEAPGETKAREAELFGGAEEAPSGDDEGLDLAARLDAEEDTLAIGAFFYGRLDYSAVDAPYPETHPLRAPQLLDLYLDARPNPRVRVYGRGRLLHELTATRGSTDRLGRPVEATRVALDQLWLNFDVARTVFVTVGRQPLRWGSGRFWNPTDFLSQQFRDPLALFDDRLGTAALKVHLPIESLGWNFYAVANFEGAESPEKVGAALRGELLFGTTEVALTAAVRKDDPLRLGASFSAGIWLFDVRGEVALLHGVTEPYYEGPFDPETFLFPEAVDRSEAWLPRVTLGADIGLRYSDEDSLYLGAEYFYNSLGYSDPEIYPFLLLRGQFTPFYLGRHYAALYLLLPSPGSWNDANLTLSALGNLSDRSFLARLDLQVTVLTHLVLNVYAAYHFGSDGELRLRISLPPLEYVPGLEAGLEVPAPTLDLGMGARVRF
ncbi:MAG: hypothetical protein D6729_07890 [Deltaproteobacteria bacterium]|nr:MAG: hypothetical protein D6729_07890 [Deltaproteobacteria bacterium]